MFSAQNTFYATVAYFEPLQPLYYIHDLGQVVKMLDTPSE